MISILNIKNNKNDLSLITLFNIPFFYFEKENKKIRFVNLIKTKKNNKKKEIFYLKFNTDNNQAYNCLQRWIDAINLYNGDFYILCDKPNQIRKIKKRITFYDTDIKFLKSCKNRTLKRIVKNIATKQWVKATFAHLTTFWHPYKKNINSCWNIDADDTLFLCSIEDMTNILKEVARQAKTNNIDAFSLDMHRTNRCGTHWSFGVCYQQNLKKLINKFMEEKSPKWQEKHRKFDCSSNLDWYLTYLKNIKQGKFETWYVENLNFVHTSYLQHPLFGFSVYKWENGNLKNPLLNMFNSELKSIPIFNDVIKIDYNLKQNTYDSYLSAAESIIYESKHCNKLIELHKSLTKSDKTLNSSWKE